MDLLCELDLFRAAKEYCVPLALSSLTLLPCVNMMLPKRAQVAIFCANSESLAPLIPRLNKSCGLDASDNHRFINVGLQDVPGFEAVALGDQVDIDLVTPGIVNRALLL